MANKDKITTISDRHHFKRFVNEYNDLVTLLVSFLINAKGKLRIVNFYDDLVDVSTHDLMGPFYIFKELIKKYNQTKQNVGITCEEYFNDPMKILVPVFNKFLDELNSNFSKWEFYKKLFNFLLEINKKMYKSTIDGFEKWDWDLTLLKQIKSIFWLVDYNSFLDWGYDYFSKEEEKYVFHFELLKLSKMKKNIINLDVIDKEQLNYIISTLEGINVKVEQLDYSSDNVEMLDVLHSALNSLCFIKEKLFKIKFPDGNIKNLKPLLRDLKVKEIFTEYIDEKWNKVSYWRHASKRHFSKNKDDEAAVKSIIDDWNNNLNNKDRKIVLMQIIDEFKIALNIFYQLY